MSKEIIDILVEIRDNQRYAIRMQEEAIHANKIGLEELERQSKEATDLQKRAEKRGRYFLFSFGMLLMVLGATLIALELI